MQSSPLNYDSIQAQTVTMPPALSSEFWIIGCGGTGSFLTQLLCRLVAQLNQAGKTAKLVLVDPDIVEHKNLARQCFCEAEIGLNKAEALAARYSAAWGLEIEAIPQLFEARFIDRYSSAQIIMLGCVDRAPGRVAMAQALEANNDSRSNIKVPRLWWIDGGNGNRFGQVMVGSGLSQDPADYTFSDLGCVLLPAPSIQAPELLIDSPDTLKIPSCAEQLLLNVQGLMVNPQTAVIMADIAMDLISGTLKHLAVHFDQISKTFTSTYITEANVRSAIRQQQQIKST